jgi:hypothetical protein
MTAASFAKGWLGLRLSVISCGLEVIGILGILAMGNHTPGTTAGRWMAALAFAPLMLAPITGCVGFGIGLARLRRGTVDRALAAESAVFGALAMAGPWLFSVFVCLYFCFAED